MPFENPIRHQSLSEQCYEVLREEIASGAIVHGERLFEDRIAQRLGVSKTPVRFALQRLHQEALVEFRERRGFYVVDFVTQDLRDVVELREMLEAIAVRRLAEGATPAITRELHACIDHLEDDDLDVTEEAFARADAAFHSRLVELAGSDLLSRMRGLLDIRIQFYLVRGPSLGIDVRRRLHNEHLAIIEAIGMGQRDHAEALIREHISDAWGATRQARLAGSAGPGASLHLVSETDPDLPKRPKE